MKLEHKACLQQVEHVTGRKSAIHCGFPSRQILLLYLMCFISCYLRSLFRQQGITHPTELHKRSETNAAHMMWILREHQQLLFDHSKHSLELMITYDFVDLRELQ